MLPDLTPLQWLLGIACGVMLGFSKTGIAGLGVVIAPLMTDVFPARESTAAMLLMLVFGDVFAMGYYRRHADWKMLLSLLPWVLPGIVLGYLALAHLSDAQVKPALGALILGLVILQVARSRMGEWMDKRLPHTVWFVAGTGVVAGFATMLANAAGGIMTVFFLAKGLPKREFMGTAAWFFLIVNLVKIPFSGGLGLANEQTLTFAALMIPAITAGALIGVRVLPLVPQETFSRIVLVIAAVASAKLVLAWGPIAEPLRALWANVAG